MLEERRSDHKAFALLFADIVTNVMALADSPGRCCEYIASQVRELLAMRSVVIMECTHLSGAATHKLLAVLPERRREMALMPEMNHLALLSHDMETVTYIHPDSPPESGGDLLRGLGLGDTVVVPLQHAGIRIGVIFLLGVMDAHGIESIISTLERLSPILALILRNAHLYNNLEQEVASRTAELQASDERYSRAVRGTTDGIWDWNILTDENYLSPRWKELVGFAEDELPNHRDSFLSLLHPEDLPRVQAAAKAHLEKRTPYDIEFRMRTQKGDYRWFQSRGKAEWNEQGLAVRMTGSIRDITKRKLMESKLHETQAILQTSLDNSAAGIAIADAPDGRLRYVNNAGLGIKGGERDELVNGVDIQTYVSSWQIHHLDGTPYRAEDVPLTRALLKGEHVSEEFKIKRPGDEWRTVLANAAPILDDKGQIVAAIVVFLDITERKQQEDSIRRKEYEFRLLAESMPQIVWVCSPDGSNIYFNQQWVDYTGLTLEESYGNGWNKPFHPDDQQAAMSAWRNATKNNAAYVLESRLRRADGAYEWWLIRGVPIFEEHGDILKWFGTCTNIEGLKQSEAKLIQAKKAAEAASVAKSEFLANMSHEIRTPLNGVLGMLQLLETTRPTVEQKEYLLAAIQSSRRLTRLLSDILDLSRIEAGKLVIEEVEFEVMNQKQSVMELFEAPAKQKCLELNFVIDEQLPPKLLGDEARLRQIFFNLVGNAIKFTEKGRVLIEASPLTLPGKSPAKVLFMVQDTGVGIPPDRLKDIFEPFVQAEGSYTRRFQGAGLGLSIVRKLVGILSGDISIDSAPGEGTTVYLSLPFKLPSAGQGLIASPQPNAQPTVETRLRVLFAEDDKISLLSGKKMLEKSGYVVTTAVDGQEALQRLSEQAFDLILMDIQMPVMDGVEATKLIRASGASYADIPIIAMTAYAMAGDKEKFLAAGMNDYISKPADITELRAVIERMMSVSS